MTYSVRCSCGYVVESDNEAEFYNLVRRHIIPLDTEVHRPKDTPDALTAAEAALGAMLRERFSPMRAAG